MHVDFYSGRHETVIEIFHGIVETQSRQLEYKIGIARPATFIAQRVLLKQHNIHNGVTNELTYYTYYETD
jgi:hypothetical protein